MTPRVRYGLVRVAGSLPERRLRFGAIMDELTAGELADRARRLESVRVWLDGRHRSERRYAYNVLRTWPARPEPDEIQRARSAILEVAPSDPGTPGREALGRMRCG